MSTQNHETKDRGKIEGTIQLDTGRKEILSKLANLKSQVNRLSEEFTEKNQQNVDLAKRLSDKLATDIRELKQDALNKIREENSSLKAIRKTLAQLDSQQEKQIEQQYKILNTAQQLQDDFIFQEKLAPGINEVIKARDMVIGHLNSLEETYEYRSFLEGLDSALRKSLNKFGVEEVEPENGDEFDPNVQKVVKEEETLEVRRKNKVLEVLKPGYVWKDSLIRPQQVKIAQYSGGKNE